MTDQSLMDALQDVEFCDIATGRCYRAIGVTQENGGTVVLLEQEG